MEKELSVLHKEFEGMQRYQSLQSKITSLKEDIARLDREALELEVSMNQEQRDVERVEKGGVQTFFLKVFGKYEETRQKEVLEAAAASMKWQEKKEQLANAEERLYQMQKEQQTYRQCESNYQRLYEERLVEILEEEGECREKVLRLKQENAESEHMIKEIKEALAAGEEVLNSLKEALEEMEAAESYGTWDLLGGGFVTGCLKHGHIDEATEAIKNVQQKLRSYKTELADVRLVLDLSVQISSFDKFADLFIDGLFSDLNMQSKIKDTIESIEKAIKDVESVQDRLYKMNQQELNFIKNRQSEIESIVREG